MTEVIGKCASEMTAAEYLRHLADVDVPRDIHPLIQSQVSERLHSIALQMDPSEDQWAAREIRRLREKNRDLNRRCQAADAAAADAKRCLDALAAGTEKGTPWCSGSMGRALLAWYVSRIDAAAQAVVDDYLRLHPRFDVGQSGDHGVVIRELRKVLNKEPAGPVTSQPAENATPARSVT